MTDTTFNKLKDKELIDHRHIIKDSPLDQAFNNLAGNFVEILNDALAKKDTEIKYWKSKAYILANKNGLCYKHETRESESNFNQMGKSFEYYIEHGVDCSECDYNKQENHGK